MFIFRNSNPCGCYVGDCVIRAISEILGIPWRQVYLWLIVYGFSMCDMPSSNHVWGSFLHDKGFRMFMIPEAQFGDYTVSKFCRDNPVGKFILATGTHVIAVINGNYIDTWDSGDELPVYYWREK